MIRRTLIGALIVATVAAFAPSPRQGDVSAAPSQVSISRIIFAEGVTDRLEPINPKIEFGRDEERVWAIVDYNGLAPGTRLSYLLRLNDGDYLWGRLDCCGGQTSGRMAFPLQRPTLSGKDLPGAAYTLFIYDGDTEIGRGGFGVRGGRGSDSGDPPSND